MLGSCIWIQAFVWASVIVGCVVLLPSNTNFEVQLFVLSLSNILFSFEDDELVKYDPLP